ncbi:MAG: bifunctional DNA-formamidopyrimidine glycosylase/DNA-(apurinic or apyrimidinic site) lyase [Thermogutta sp.]|nr:bifunctional DNA-formamidopyrimidine glycosylase/DNA-(apurinic or apyrimidinic site) lyase [Thermogutta sp.]
MPELPEVETMRRGLLPIVGGRIVSAAVPRSSLRAITFRPDRPTVLRGLRGRRIREAVRLGKRLVLCLDDGKRLVLEPRMTGRVLLDVPGPISHVRLILEVLPPEGVEPAWQESAAPGLAARPGDAAFARRVIFRDVRGLGVVSLMDERTWRRELGPHKIGPDALEIDAPTLRSRLGSRRTAVKVALLDQKAVAGIGNIYASEALHRAKIHPAEPCMRLSSRQWRRLHAAIRDVLTEAVELQGSTLTDGAYGTPGNQSGRYQDRHLVYQRDGRPCLQCGKGVIQRIVLGQRSTFFCPRCQRRLPRRREG